MRPRRTTLLVVLVVVALGLVAATIAAVAWRWRQDRARETFDARAKTQQYRLGHLANVLSGADADDKLKPPEYLLDIEGRLAELDGLSARVDDEERREWLANLHGHARKLHALVDRDARDEKIFTDAITIVQGRDLDGYGRAAESLARIESNTRFHGDAQTYVHWLRADAKVREATTLTKQGDKEAARALLRAVLEWKDLGPDARASVEKRLEALDRE